MADASHLHHARVPATESTTIVTVAVIERVVEVSEPGAEVLLTASAQNPEEKMTATIAAGATTTTAATGTTTVMAITTVMTATDAETEAETADVLTVAIRCMKNMITSLSPILRVMVRLWSSEGRRLLREGITKPLPDMTGRRDYEVMTV